MGGTTDTPSSTGPTPSTASPTNGQTTIRSPPLDTDISTLAAALSATSNVSEDRELSGEDLAALLRQLEQADGVAKGVESRLDKLLNGLDQLLGSIGEDDEKGVHEEAESDRAKPNGSHDDAT
jgi:hypothetical protein